MSSRWRPLLAAVATAAALGIGACAPISTDLIATSDTSAVHHPTTPPRGAVGRDVGAQSCLATLPSGASFGIIGVTGGRPFHSSACLSPEYTWASGLTYRPQYYINLADPGHASSHWGHGGPRACHRKPKYDVGCAFDYGSQTAAAAWSAAKAAGSDGRGHWWLDVEVDNTWGTSASGIAANLADIRGALRYLRSRQHTSVGIYTETSWWDTITHGSTHFSGVATWGGGANSKRHARANCRPHSITGGPALVAQWIVGSVDHDIAC
jgi:hypothetical protein